MDGNLWVCRDLAARPAPKLAKMGLYCRAGQSTDVAFLRVLSSPMEAAPRKLLVCVFLGPGRVEFLDKAESGVEENSIQEVLADIGFSELALIDKHACVWHSATLLILQRITPLCPKMRRH
jgi:hypothetical protein